MASCDASTTTNTNKRWNKRRYCCVKGCHNREGSGVKLYRFPSRDWEKNRREKWIAAVRRVNGEDYSNWFPSKDGRICCKHFVNDEKSTIEAHPAYLPTVFPPVFKKRPVKPAVQLAKSKRRRQRPSIPSSSVAVASSTTSSALPQGRDGVDASCPATIVLTVMDTLSSPFEHAGLDLLCAAAQICTAPDCVVQDAALAARSLQSSGGDQEHGAGFLKVGDIGEVVGACAACGYTLTTLLVPGVSTQTERKQEATQTPTFVCSRGAQTCNL